MVFSILPHSVNNGLDINCDASHYRAERTPGAVAVSGGVRQGTGGDISSLPVLPQTNSEACPDKPSTTYQCGSLIVFTECETGEHHFAKKILCGKEWCPDCGEDGSQAHNRKIARLLPKFQQMSQLGYFVIEFPDRYRKIGWKDPISPDNEPVTGWCYNKEDLKATTRTIIDVLGGKRGRGAGSRKGGYFSRGLARWHWFGDKVEGKYNPHLNVVVDGAYIDKKNTLEKIKADLKQALNCPDLIVNYGYFEQPGEIYHKLKYITRATFRNYAWSPYMARQLHNFRNIRWWGEWKDEPAWTLNKEIEAEADVIALKAVSSLGCGICPECGAKLKKWSRPVDSAFLVMWAAREIGNTGYYCIPHCAWSGGELSPQARLRLEQLERDNAGISSYLRRRMWIRERRDIISDIRNGL